MVYLASDTQHMKAIFFYQSMKLFVQVGLYYYQNSIPKLYLESSQFQNSQLYLAQHTRNLSLNYRVSHTNNVHHVFYSISLSISNLFFLISQKSQSANLDYCQKEKGSNQSRFEQRKLSESLVLILCRVFSSYCG